MFLASFALFTRIFTSFLRFKRGLIFLFASLLLTFLVLFGITLWKRKKKPEARSLFSKQLKKLIRSQIISFLLAGTAISFALWNASPSLFSNFWSFSELEIQEQSAFSPFLQEVLIVEQTKPNTYIVQTASGEAYFLKTEKSHQLGTSIQLGASLKARDPKELYTELSLGSGFDMQSFLEYQFNYDKRLLMKGIAGTLYEKFSLPSAKADLKPSWWTQKLITARTRLRTKIQNTFPEQEWALLLGMLIGEKSQLESQEYQNFVASGIVHIIAVSGGNLVMIVVFLGAVLFWVPFYLRNGLIILGVIAFALLCGGDSSVVRALIMAVLSLFALFRGREIQIWRLLKYAFVAMLCYNPFFLTYDLGFLLSFGAVIGIVIVSEWWAKMQEAQAWKVKSKEKKIRLSFFTNFLKNYGLPTLWATLGTLPILLFFIGQTNLTGVVVNLIIVPLIPIITIGGFCAVVLASRTGWTWIALPITWLLSFVFRASELAIKRGFAIELTTTWAKWGFTLVMIGIGILMYLLIKKKK